MSRVNPKEHYRTLIEKAANYTATRFESGAVLRSTVNAVRFTLPNSTADADTVGAVFEVECVSNTCSCIPSAGGDVINYQGVGVAEIFLNSVSDRVKLFCSSVGVWDLVEYTGNPLLDTVPISIYDSTPYVHEVNVAGYPFTDFNIDALHVLYTATGGCTITVASALIAISGFTFTIKDTGLNAAANPITIETEGAETIEGQANAVIQIDGGALTLQSDGTNLWII